MDGWTLTPCREVNGWGWGGASEYSDTCKSTFHYSDVACTHVLMMCCVVWCLLLSVS